MRHCVNILFSITLLFHSATPRSTNDATAVRAPRSYGNGTAQACADLKALSPAKLVSQRDRSAYQAADNGYWTENTRGTPSCIFSPESAHDVSEAIVILQRTGAQFAVRGGGHNGNFGWASIDNGVLISMSNITKLQYNAASSTITIGFGNRWGQIYDYLRSYNRTAVGGRCNDVGMGLLLGGGISYLTTLHGLAATNVISYEVVLANGTIATANQGQYSDLYWALKGGGSNFGIVTHATLKTYSTGSGKVWGGIVEYNNTEYQDQLMSALAEYQLSGQDQDPNTSVEIEFLQTANITIATYVTLNSDTRPSSLDPFFRIPSLVDGTQAWSNFAEFNTNTNPPINPTRYYIASTTFRLDRDTYVEVADTVQQQWLKLPPIAGGDFAISPQPVSPSMVTASSASGGNPIGLNPTYQLWFSVAGSWNCSSDDKVAIDAVNNAINLVQTITTQKGLHEPYIFYNEASSVQHPILRYTGLDRLRVIAREYDPHSLFRTQMPGGFKLY